MPITTIGTPQGQVGDMLVVGKIVALLYTPARGSASPPVYKPGDYCWKPEIGIRQLSLDRGGSLGPGDPSVDPADSAGTGSTGSWRVPDFEDAASATLNTRIAALESERARFIDRRGETSVPASAIGSIVQIDRNVSLPRANFTGRRLSIDFASYAGIALQLAGASGVSVDDRTSPNPGGACTAILTATDQWLLVGAI